MSGPLGALPGMTFDIARNRYFPTPPSTFTSHRPSASSSSLSILPEINAQNKRAKHYGRKMRKETADIQASHAKRARNNEMPMAGRVGTGKSGNLKSLRKCQIRPTKQIERDERTILGRLQLDQRHHLCGCEGETITFYQPFGQGAFSATTDHGKMILNSADGDTTVLYICPQTLLGLHYDIPRMILMAISSGPEPHIHIFRRDPSQLDHIHMRSLPLKPSQGDLYSMSSFDDRCTLGGYRSINTISYAESDRVSALPRKLASDALAIHHVGRDLVYVGQRSGMVVLEDLREKSRMPNVVGQTIVKKAVVGVKRIDDGAVPWGLIVSGMEDELLLYDIRFSNLPLLSFDGHVNNYQTDVGLALSPTNAHIFSSGSDNRIRAWSTLTGQPIAPTLPSDGHEWPSTNTYPVHNGVESCRQPRNPLTMAFDRKVSHLVVNEDLGLDGVVGGELIRFIH
ncbi:hypothetical protein L204_103645 [Cryptococcus depauperatus]